MNKIDPPQIPEYINLIETSEISKYISKTDLLITDYSSICFDFMYLNIPVLFYPFDYQALYLNEEDTRSSIDFLNFQNDLYNVCFNESQVFDVIKKYIKNNFILEESNLEKNKDIFYEDKNHCEKLYEQLVNSEKSNSLKSSI